jgi:ComF family protein
MTRLQVDRLIDRIGGMLLPPRCVLCGAPGQLPCLDLCRECELELPLAGDCAPHDDDGLARSFALYRHAAPVDELVHALKYRGDLAVGRVLGTLLGRHVVQRALHAHVDRLVPVPLHPARLASRGYNQSAELARWVARETRRPLAVRMVRRLRDTPPQVGLAGPARRRNLASAFGASPSARGLCIAIVDDDTTTGSTAGELGRALKRAGAERVEAWCLARAG